MNTVASTQKQLSIRDHLESPELLAEIEKALPSHMSAERMARVAITAMMRTPDLAKCTQASFFKCLLDLSSWGLEPDGRRAHLIPFRNSKAGTVECQLILDYKGIVELCYRSGYVRNIHADVVRVGDLFEFNLGKVTRHTPWAFLASDLRRPEAGDIIAAYCLVEMKDNATKCEVMTRDEIDGIRRRSKASSSGPWVTDYSEMAKKTVFKRASKWLPLSAEIVDAMDRDYDKFPPIENRKANTLGIQELLGSSEPEDEKVSDE
jgi:recombination protein RecT